jgi:hypothetical protein
MTPEPPRTGRNHPEPAGATPPDPEPPGTAPAGRGWTYLGTDTAGAPLWAGPPGTPGPGWTYAGDTGPVTLPGGATLGPGRVYFQVEDPPQPGEVIEITARPGPLAGEP